MGLIGEEMKKLRLTKHRRLICELRDIGTKEGRRDLIEIANSLALITELIA